MYRRKTEDFLQRFGVGGDYKGFYFCSYSMELVAEDPNNLLFVTKNIYPEVAREYHTTCKCVERDIRTVAEAVWRNGGR